MQSIGRIISPPLDLLEIGLTFANRKDSEGLMVFITVEKNYILVKYNNF